VRVTGADGHGQRVTREWQVLAQAEKGPEIPCRPAILLTRQMARGELPPGGARACVSELALADFAPQFARWSTQTQVRELG